MAKRSRRKTRKVEFNGVVVRLEKSLAVLKAGTAVSGAQERKRVAAIRLLERVTPNLREILYCGPSMGIDIAPRRDDYATRPRRAR